MNLEVTLYVENQFDVKSKEMKNTIIYTKLPKIYREKTGILVASKIATMSSAI